MKRINISSGEDVILDHIDDDEENLLTDEEWKLCFDSNINPHAYSNWELMQQAYAE